MVYLTVFDKQTALIDLLEYYGFRRMGAKPDGELIYEKSFSRDQLVPVEGVSHFDTDRLNYPRFIARAPVRAFGVPIREGYHDTLYPDLSNPTQPDLFDALRAGGSTKRPGNTIRKVYLCRAQSRLGPAGSLLFFYKGMSKNPPSQALTAIGIFEEMSEATSTKELMQLTGGRSVYSETELIEWKASSGRPVRVINFLLAAYIDPPATMAELKTIGIFGGHPPQSIFEIRRPHVDRLLDRIDFGFVA